MRKELELIEKIEAWLQGGLSPEEMQQMEEQLANDPQLQAEVELQRQLMTGIHRASLKEQAIKAKKRYVFRRRLTQWGLGAGILLLLAVALIYYKQQNHTLPHTPQGTTGSIKTDTAQPTGIEPANPRDSSTAGFVDVLLKHDNSIQSFLITTSRDTVIETRKGIVLSILSQTFLDEANRPVTGKFQLLLKEALDPASIMTAGLSTRSGTQPLSTGGMFFLDARQGSRILHIDTTRPVIAQIPAAQDQYNMQLYKGIRKPDSTIDWVAPRPLEHGLVAVDPQLLDFYPPHYLDSLRKWGFNSRDRRFTDSLYYSLAAAFRAQPQQEAGPKEGRYAPRDTVALLGDSIIKLELYDHPRSCGIDPAKIKTIWSQEFRNTFIATLAFEQRLQWLHVCSNADKLLDLYVTHLDWDLSDVDSLVATRSSGEQQSIFRQFAARHDGKVNNMSPQFRQLAQYYEMKARAYAAAITKTENDYWSRQAELDKVSLQHTADSSRRIAQNFQEELMINLVSAAHQLGYEIVANSNPNPPPEFVYTASISTTGWHNIDKAVTEATITRTTLDLIDRTVGKRAVIRYLPVNFQIRDWQRYDRLYVYLLPDKLSSFLLITGAEGNYMEKLNELLKYDLVCIGYKGDQAWYYHRRGIQPTTYTNIRLSSINAVELTRQLNQVGNMTQSSELQNENSFYQFDIKDQKRRQHNKDLEALRWRLLRMIFPCWTLNL